MSRAEDDKVEGYCKEHGKIDVTPTDYSKETEMPTCSQCDRLLKDFENLWVKQLRVKANIWAESKGIEDLLDDDDEEDDRLLRMYMVAERGYLLKGEKDEVERYFEEWI